MTLTEQISSGARPVSQNHSSFRHIPDGSVLHPSSTDKISIYTMEVKGVPYAIAYVGKSKDAAFYCWFQTKEVREAHIKNFLLKACLRRAQRVSAAAARKAEASAYDARENFKAGDILVYSWGWEQTNVEFFTVVKVPSKCRIEIRPIGSKQVEQTGNGMAAYVVPDAEVEVRSKSQIKHVGANGAIKMQFGFAHKTNPTAKHYCSWYA